MRSPFRLVRSFTLVVTTTLVLVACKSDGGKAAPPSPGSGSAATTRPPVDKPHGDHNAKYGGVVMMAADVHFEAVLGTDGKHRVYWSDQARDPLPGSALEHTALTVVRPGEPPEEVAMAKDPTDQFWEGQGKPLAEPTKAEVTVTFNKPGVPSSKQLIVYPVTAAGHDHSHGGDEPPLAMPASLGEAAASIDAANQELAGIVKDGDLAKAHPVAERLAKLGAGLGELATKAGRSADDVKALTVAGKKLALFFSDMDQAGDSGDRAAAQKAYARYAEPLATIKTKAAP